MNRIKLLPHWVLPDTLPSVYDTQSGTALEMVAKVYGAMRDLQKDYNSFVDEINKTIINFQNGIIQDQDDFKAEINKIVHDYIAMLDLKIAHQDIVIEENIVYIKENLAAEVTRIINEMKESGELEEIVANAFDILSNKVSTLETDVSDLKTSTTNLNDRVGEFENNISDLQNESSNLSNEITSLHEKDTELGNDINTINGNIEDINGNIEDINNDIGTLNNYNKVQNSTNVTLVSGYSFNNSGFSQCPILEKEGKIVHFAMNVESTGENYLPTEETKIAQLPEGFRPKYTQIFTCGISENVWMLREHARLMIDTSGNVFIRDTSGNQRKYAFINVVFLTN